MPEKNNLKKGLCWLMVSKVSVQEQLAPLLFWPVAGQKYLVAEGCGRRKLPILWPQEAERGRASHRGMGSKATPPGTCYHPILQLRRLKQTKHKICQSHIANTHNLNPETLMPGSLLLRITQTVIWKIKGQMGSVPGDLKNQTEIYIRGQQLKSCEQKNDMPKTV